MKSLFLAMWDAYDRRRYKPDAYLERVENATRHFTCFPWNGDKVIKQISARSDWTYDVTEQVAILKEFSVVSLKLWKSLGESGLLDAMGDYSKRLQRMEQLANRIQGARHKP